MRFIKFNGWGGKSQTFALDYIEHMRPDNDNTIVVMFSGNSFLLEIDYEDFIKQVFADIMEEEYNLIEIDYTNPEPVA